MSFASLWLEGPLQSWGVDSRFGRRETLKFPSRSGILGIVCCAMGLPGAQREWLALWRDLNQTIVAYPRANATYSSMPPLLRDFQMVGAAYDNHDSWENLLIPKKSDGKRPVGSGAILTYRYYLQDMAFACALELPQGHENSIVEGLQNPVWNICLGRKNCPPSAPLFRGLFESEEDALAEGARLAATSERNENFIVKTASVDDMDAITLHDVPIAFGPRKEYADRKALIFPARDDDESDA